MKKPVKVATIYSHKSTKTSQVAKLIHKHSSWENIEDIDVENLMHKGVHSYNLLLLGVPSWFDGELPVYWDELVPYLEELDLKGKIVAIFGNANQVDYPENFGDAVGIMAEILSSGGATVIGYTSSEDYTFEKSKALEGNLFKGLILDFENQQDKNEHRVKSWLQSIEKSIES